MTKKPVAASAQCQDQVSYGTPRGNATSAPIKKVRMSQAEVAANSIQASRFRTTDPETGTRFQTSIGAAISSRIRMLRNTCLVISIKLGGCHKV